MTTPYERGGVLEPGTVYVRLQPSERVLTGAEIRAAVDRAEPSTPEGEEPPC